MLFIYNLLIQIAGFFLKIVALFIPKIKLFVDGRKDVFEDLLNKINYQDKTIWFHVASLGEYEQGLPVIEKIKIKYPNHKIVLTFFSPSGFEVRKNNKMADITTYLPLDTNSNVKNFLEIVHPEMVFFIKYEYWPNYLKELRKRKIKTYLVSGIFRKQHIFFKWYGSFFSNALKSFDYFFVQNDSSKLLLQFIGFNNVKVSGDTRFDRVTSILERNNSINSIEEFKNKQTTIVIGSSWSKDEDLILNYINQSNNVKFIIAPHNINEIQILNLKSKIQKAVSLYSEKDNLELSEFNVLIIDSIGILTKIYSYADIAYVGGGFGKPGIHNILEPATFGVPIVIGPNFLNFAEAVALVNLQGCITISNQQELNEAFDILILNEDIRQEKGHICSTFVNMNKGATDMIIKHLE